MSPSLRKRFGARVQELRKASGVTQEVFAERCGFVRPYMSRIETGRANVSLDAIETLAVALRISVEDIFKGL